MIVADIKDGNFPEAFPARHKFIHNTPARILWTGDVHQERNGWCKVDRTDICDRVLVTNAWSRCHESAMHVDVMLEIHQIRQVAVLSEEL